VKKGIVVATHPSDHSVDLVLADGRRMVGVQVATPNGSTRSGTFDMPAVPEKADKWDITKLTGQDQIALVDFVGDIPVVVGFLFPQISQMTFDDPKMRVTRHQSDVLQMVDGNGNIDLIHPSGFAVRIGETPDHAQPAAKNTDASLAVDRNVGRKPYIRITMADGTAQVTIAPDGAITVTTKKTIDMHADGAIKINSGTSIKLTAPRIDFN